MDCQRIVTNWATLLMARDAYSVPLFENGQCRVFDYEERRYTTTTMAFAVEAHTQEAWCYEVVSIEDYADDIPADRIEPLRRHAYPGLIVKIEGTEEEVVITSHRLYLKAEEPEEEHQVHLLIESSPARRNHRDGKAIQHMPVDGQPSLL